MLLPRDGSASDKTDAYSTFDITPVEPGSTTSKLTDSARPLTPSASSCDGVNVAANATATPAATTGVSLLPVPAAPKRQFFGAFNFARFLAAVHIVHFHMDRDLSAWTFHTFGQTWVGSHLLLLMQLWLMPISVFTLPDTAVMFSAF